MGEMRCESCTVWAEILLVTSVIALLDTSNLALTVVCSSTFISLTSFALYESHQWVGVVPLWASIMVLLVKLQRTIKRIGEMDSFAVHFKTVDAKLGLERLKNQEDSTKTKVFKFTAATNSPISP